MKPKFLPAASPAVSSYPAIMAVGHHGTPVQSGSACAAAEAFLDLVHFIGHSMGMIKLNIHEIKTQFSKYIDRVEAGETVVVCKRNIPVAEIRRIESRTRRTPVLGSAAGQGKILTSFYEPMSEGELRLWEDGHGKDPLRAFAPVRKKAR